MTLGVDYYPEHWPEARWVTDARLMREAGFQVVRLAEFAWAKIEPAEGEFDWGWLDRAVETLAGAGLQVVCGGRLGGANGRIRSALPMGAGVREQG